MPKYGKNRANTAIVFDTLNFSDFDTIASLGAGVANTTVQARLLLPQRFKIFKVGVVYSAVGSGTHAFNIVVGPGAYTGAQTTKDASSILGTQVFATDQVFSAGADIGQVFIPTNTDCIYDVQAAAGPSSFCPLTLRLITPGATGSLSNCKVTIMLCAVDALTNRSGAVAGVDY